MSAPIGACAHHRLPVLRRIRRGAARPAEKPLLRKIIALFVIAFSAFMVIGRLLSGVHQTPQGYYVDDADVEEFDKSFPPKEKRKLPGQIF